MGGKMSPTAVLVIQNGHAKMIPVKQGDTVSKVIDMIPEVVDKIATAMGKKADVDIDSPEIKEAIDQASENNLDLNEITSFHSVCLIVCSRTNMMKRRH